MNSFIDELFNKYKLSKSIREYLLERSDFQKLIKKIKYRKLMDIDTADKIITLVKFVQGSCPKCGGRMVSRSGVHFENQVRCIVCDLIKDA